MKREERSCRDGPDEMREMRSSPQRPGLPFLTSTEPRRAAFLHSPAPQAPSHTPSWAPAPRLSGCCQGWGCWGYRDAEGTGGTEGAGVMGVLRVLRALGVMEILEILGFWRC